MSNLDAIDQRLIAMLATTPAKAWPPWRRGWRARHRHQPAAKLEDNGVIVGYTVRLRPAAASTALQAWMSITIEGNEAGASPPACSASRACRRCTPPTASGLLAELQADSPAGLSRVLERIRLIKGIRHTKTNIHLQTLRATQGGSEGNSRRSSVVKIPPSRLPIYPPFGGILRDAVCIYSSD